MNYGPLLRATREFRGFTQSDMGEKLGLDRTVISRMEKGKVGLLMDRGFQWFQITDTQKVVELMMTGVEITVIIDSLSTLLGGFILWI